MVWDKTHKDKSTSTIVQFLYKYESICRQWIKIQIKDQGKEFVYEIKFYKTWSVLSSL